VLGFSEHSREDDPSGIDPERVAHLLGDWESPGWRFPAALCLVASSVVGLLVGVAALAARVARGSATLAPPLLSRQPCILTLALIPCGLGLGAIYIRRRIVARSAS
jgi:hypothetical protein